MTYKRFDDTDLLNVQAFLPKEQILYGDQITEEYCHDEMGYAYCKPDVVLFVLTTDQASKVMKYAYDNNIVILARGSGTGLVGGCVPISKYGGIVLCTNRMNKIVSLDEQNLTLTVECGALLLDINKYLEDTPYFYPPDPGEKSATIGGNISTNAGGMRAVKYGVTRDFVLGLTCVCTNGNVIDLGGKTVKNSSGYSLKDLVVGSEGTLCLVTEAILKLLPKPKFSLSALVPFDSLEKAVGAVPRIISSCVVPTAIEFFERKAIMFAEDYMAKKFPDNTFPAYVLMTFDGSGKEAVFNDFHTVADFCVDQLQAEDVFIVDTQERREMVWSARSVLLEAIKSSTTDIDECDVVVPRSCVAEFINFTYTLSARYGVRMPSFGHAGDGNLHIYLCRDQIDKPEFEKKMQSIFDELYSKADQLGGKVSGEHGIGSAKRKYLLNTLGYQHQLMLGIKKAFDPTNILNPDKVI